MNPELNIALTAVFGFVITSLVLIKVQLELNHLQKKLSELILNYNSLLTILRKQNPELYGIPKSSAKLSADSGE